MAIDGFFQCIGRLEVPRHRVGDRLPQKALTLAGEIGAFAQAVLPEHIGEQAGIEIALGILEDLVGPDAVGELAVRNRELHLACLGIEGGIADHVVQIGAVQSKLARLFGRDRLACLPLVVLQPVSIGFGEGLARNLLIAHGCERGSGAKAEDVGDAPDAKAQDQETHEHLGHPALGGTAHSIEHQHTFFLQSPGWSGAHNRDADHASQAMLGSALSGEVAPLRREETRQINMLSNPCRQSLLL
jgi:hypothetical protein